jgi:type IV pilus assembly protein PilV
MKHSSSKSEIGASLIEVLVSIVIASIGLLALAGINASSLRYGKLSQYRATATLLVTDLAERMRANNVAGGALASYTYQSDFATQATLSAQPSPACDASASCNAAQMAAQDIWAWRKTVRNALPEGSVFLIPYTTKGSADVWVVWRDAVVSEQIRTGGALECPNNLSVSGDDSIRCMYFRVRI